ncbi:MAG TPA: aldehyde dehydrogenase family protein, partial [Chthonomonadales bacterium]|nr:aldehyde dehydrogenase family protein [Chthonomonadales bacterium]
MMELCSIVAGRRIERGATLAVTNPYNGETVGCVLCADREITEQALESTGPGSAALTRYERYQVLDRARRTLLDRAEAFARLICAESGLCIR